MTNERAAQLVICHPTAKELAHAAGLSVQDARRILSRLLRAGLVTRTRRGGSTTYHHTPVDFARMSLGALELPR